MSKRQRILLTGGTSGIGYFALCNILKSGHEVFLICRNNERALNITEKIKSNISSKLYNTNPINFIIADLADLKSLNERCEFLLKSSKNFDTLILNAGLQYTGAKEPIITKDGLELTFAVNHLSHFFLTLKLFSLLLKSENPKLVITASEVHNPESSGGNIGKIASLGSLEGLKNNFKSSYMLDGKDFNADKAYKDSKLCNVLFGREISRRSLKNNINLKVICWAPGLVIPRTGSGFFRYSRQYNELGQVIFAFFARDLFKITEAPEKAGNILNEISFSEEFNKKEFTYYSNEIKSYNKHILKEKETSKDSMNEELASTLWDCSKMLIDKFVKYNIS